MTDKFDFNEALKAIQSGKVINGKDGVLAPLLKQLTEAALVDFPGFIRRLLSSKNSLLQI